MSEFSELKAQYHALTGKNPQPMSADALRVKIEELKAAAQPPAQDPPAQDPPALDPPVQDPPVQDPPADEPAKEEAAPEQSVEDACAELGLSIEGDGHCAVEIIESISGGINLSRGDPHRFEAAEAVRAVRAGIAKPRS